MIEVIPSTYKAFLFLLKRISIVVIFQTTSWNYHRAFVRAFVVVLFFPNNFVLICLYLTWWLVSLLSWVSEASVFHRGKIKKHTFFSINQCFKNINIRDLHACNYVKIRHYFFYQCLDACGFLWMFWEPIRTITYAYECNGNGLIF